MMPSGASPVGGPRRLPADASLARARFVNADAGIAVPSVSMPGA